MNILIGERIREIRQDKGLNQAELARMLNMSQKNISSIETGRTQIDLQTLKLLAELLDISIDYFFSNDANQGKRMLLTDDEIKLISLYRCLNKSKKAALINLLNK